MNCPSCQTDMRRLVRDQLADWICDRCSSLWTDSYLNKLTGEQLINMHVIWLREQASKKERYNKKPVEPEKPRKPAYVKEGGLNEWFGNI